MNHEVMTLADLKVRLTTATRRRPSSSVVARSELSACLRLLRRLAVHGHFLLEVGDRLPRANADRPAGSARSPPAPLDDERSIDQALKGDRFGEFWRYRIGDYRVIARIEDAER
jgi:hypothetical protein